MARDRVSGTPPSRRAVLQGSGAAVLLSAAPGALAAGLRPSGVFGAAATVVLQFDVASPAPAPDGQATVASLSGTRAGQIG